MRIFNQDKTQEIINYNAEMGKLVPDRLLIAHHNEVLPVAEQAHYEVVCTYENGGKEVVKVIDVPAIKGRAAYDEYEDIYVFLPYNEAEKKERLRALRPALLTAFDKWEKAVLRGREQEDAAVMAWYRAILDLEENAFKNVPARVSYYN